MKGLAASEWSRAQQTQQSCPLRPGMGPAVTVLIGALTCVTVLSRELPTWALVQTRLHV